jgi:hypothetical protein
MSRRGRDIAPARRSHGACRPAPPAEPSGAPPLLTRRLRRDAAFGRSACESGVTQRRDAVVGRLACESGVTLRRGAAVGRWVPLVCVLLSAELAGADVAVRQERQASAKRTCAGGLPKRFYACGVLGPPCCLGNRLLVPTPKFPEWQGMRALVALLASLVAENPVEARHQLAELRDQPWFRKEADPLLRANAALAPLWQAVLQDAAQPAWLSLPEARAEARRARKRLLLFFAAGWAMPSVEMEKRVFPSAEVKEALAKVVMTRIDLTDGSEAGEPWKVTAMPTLLLLDADGKEVKRATSFLDPAELVAWLAP